jgi:hypothetical protein
MWGRNFPEHPQDAGEQVSRNGGLGNPEGDISNMRFVAILHVES